MENEKKDNKRQYIDDKGQRFYFNDEGELVVETNKGVWVDGKQYAKMYGNFTCNAKTLGIIIERFREMPAVVSEMFKYEYFRMEPPFDGAPCLESCCIVNPTDDDKKLLAKIECYEARNNNMNKQVEDLKVKIEDKKANLARYWSAIDKFNRLPWYKRIFKKVEV